MTSHYFRLVVDEERVPDDVRNVASHFSLRKSDSRTLEGYFLVDAFCVHYGGNSSMRIAG